MPKFVFPLESVLRHREHAEKERMRELAVLATRCRDVCAPLYLPIVARIADDLVALADELAEAR